MVLIGLWKKASDKLGLVLHSRMFLEKTTIRVLHLIGFADDSESGKPSWRLDSGVLVLHLIGFAGDSESDKPSWRLDSGVLVLRIGQIGLDSGVLVLRIGQIGLDSCVLVLRASRGGS